jgi:hypothetical protein
MSALKIEIVGSNRGSDAKSDAKRTLSSIFTRRTGATKSI